MVFELWLEMNCKGWLNYRNFLPMKYLCQNLAAQMMANASRSICGLSCGQLPTVFLIRKVLAVVAVVIVDLHSVDDCSSWRKLKSDIFISPVCLSFSVVTKILLIFGGFSSCSFRRFYLSRLSLAFCASRLAFSIGSLACC